MIVKTHGLLLISFILVAVASATQGSEGCEEHAHGVREIRAGGAQRKTVRYEIPDVTLVNQHGEKVRLVEFLDTDEMVALNFIFATCTTVCPVLTAGFSSFQNELGDGSRVQLVSVTIDPEHDTPAQGRRDLKRSRMPVVAADISRSQGN